MASVTGGFSQNTHTAIVKVWCCALEESYCSSRSQQESFKCSNTFFKTDLHNKVLLFHLHRVMVGKKKIKHAFLEKGVQSLDRLYFCLCKSTPVLSQLRKHKTHFKAVQQLTRNRMHCREIWNVMLCEVAAACHAAWTNVVVYKLHCQCIAPLRLFSLL